MVAPEQRVHVFSLGIPKRGTAANKRRYRVKWAVDGRHKTRSFKTREQADRLRTELMLAVRQGARFDVETGEPVRWEQSTATWWSWSTEWLSVKWPRWAGNTRKGAADTVVALTPHLVRTGAPEPPASLHRWLADTGVLPNVEADPSARESRWLERWSLPLVEVTPGRLEAALTAATTRLDGKPMAPVVAKRRYNIVKGVFRAAVNRELIDSSPVGRLSWNPPRDSVAVDVTTLPSVGDVIEIVEELAADAAYRHYAAFFACVGLAGFRPSEVAGLLVSDLTLPDDGWGTARLRGALTTPGPKYTTDGKAEEEKGLKQRADNESRIVPLPPPLVGWLRWHVEQFERSGSDRLFINSKGNTLSKDNWGKPWRDQRARRWPPGHELATATTYDLRHTAATMMLRAGVSAPEVALRLGHSVDMLMKVYAGVFEDERARSNSMIDQELAALRAATTF